MPVTMIAELSIHRPLHRHLLQGSFLISCPLIILFPSLISRLFPLLLAPPGPSTSRNHSPLGLTLAIGVPLICLLDGVTGFREWINAQGQAFMGGPLVQGRQALLDDAPISISDGETGSSVMTLVPTESMECPILTVRYVGWAMVKRGNVWAKIVFYEDLCRV